MRCDAMRCDAMRLSVSDFRMAVKPFLMILCAFVWAAPGIAGSGRISEIPAMRRDALYSTIPFGKYKGLFQNVKSVFSFFCSE